MHAACALRPPACRGSQHLPRIRSTLQMADRFNHGGQPISFNTSSVTDMSHMFEVRFARALAPTAVSALLQSGPCTPPDAPLPLPGPTNLATRIVYPSCDSAGRVDAQPAAEHRNVQGQGHELHVLGVHALRACPAYVLQPSVRSMHPCTLSLHTAAATLPLPPSGPLLAPHRMPPFRLHGTQTAGKFDQPVAFDTSSVTTMQGMFHVRSLDE